MVVATEGLVAVATLAAAARMEEVHMAMVVEEEMAPGCQESSAAAVLVPGWVAAG